MTSRGRGVPPGEGRPRRDTIAIADKAARACVDDGVAKRDAVARFGIGWVRLGQAITRLHASRSKP